MTAVECVERDLAELPERLRGSSDAAVALAMAAVLDGGGRGSASECGRVLMEAMKTLRELAPPKREKGKLDDLSARRATRLGRGSAASG